MTIKKFTCGVIGTNSYLLKNENLGIVIDPADEELYQEIVDSGVKICAVLLTHGHFDHIAGVTPFQKAGVKIYAHNADLQKCEGQEMAEKMTYFGVKPFTPDIFVSDGEEIDIAGFKIKVLHTPGHSKGSVCYIIDDIILSGDTIFYGTYGRYDFYDGDFAQLKSSIVDKLFKLKGDFRVYPGHDKDTTLDYERRENMILW